MGEIEKSYVEYSIRIPKVMDRDINKCLHSGEFLDRNDFHLCAARLLLERFTMVGENRGSVTKNEQLLLETIPNIRPDQRTHHRNHRLGTKAKEGNLLRFIGCLKPDALVGVTVQLKNFPRRWKGSTWVFVRSVKEGESSNVLVKDDRPKWENSWHVALQSKGKVGDSDVYELDIREVVEQIRACDSKYNAILLRGISTLRFNRSVDLDSISIFKVS